MAIDEVEFRSVVERSGNNRKDRNFPSRADDRAADGCLFPRFVPKFSLDFSKPLKVFTIGSCFARNIEGHLQACGATLPTLAYRAPDGELPGGGTQNEMLNEYTPGTMAQRVQHGLNAMAFPAESIVPSGSGRVADLLLPGLPQKSKYDVTPDRALERRSQIDAIYRELRTSDVAILTLGFIEAWYDAHTALYLNRMPPMHFAAQNPGRFYLRRLNVDQSLALLEGPIRALSELGLKTILTVSPVPLHTTFMPADCVIANEYSKSVLRVCAEELSRSFANVDYFPSYEIVRSGGLSNFVEDNIHVKQDIVALVTNYMTTMYSMDPEDIASITDGAARTM
jgi:hypothetical protein